MKTRDEIQELATFLYEEEMLRAYGPGWRNYWYAEEGDQS